MNSQPDSPNLTPRARQALLFANEEAALHGALIVASNHLLLGLVRLGSGVAATMLNRLDVDLAALREELGKTSPSAPHQSPPAPLENDLDRILASATAIAARYGNRHIGTEHLFFAIVSDESCAAAILLRALGVENTTLRDDLTRDLFGP